MAGVERRPQEHFTPLIHTLRRTKAGAGLGGQYGSDSPPYRQRVKGRGHTSYPVVLAILGPVTYSFLLGWDTDLHGCWALLQAWWARQGRSHRSWRAVGDLILPAVHKLPYIISQLP